MNRHRGLLSCTKKSPRAAFLFDEFVGREKGTHDLRSAALRASFRAVICLMLCATGLGIAQNTNPG